jgi:uncharacterized membrane protein
MTTTDMTQHAPATAPDARSDRRLRTLSIVLAIAGLLISLYLSWTKLANVEVVCIQGISNCDAVQSSIYAYFPPGDSGIPVAVIGLAGYIAILAALLLENRVTILARLGRTLVFVMTLVGFLFSAYLTAIEAFVLHEWCQWCVLSAIIMVLLFGIAFVRMWRNISAPLEDDEA